jgi:hypothetical protein
MVQRHAPRQVHLFISLSFAQVQSQLSQHFPSELIAKEYMATNPPPTSPSLSSDPLPHRSPDNLPTPSLLNLPPELHLLITSHLPWPDLLALKHTHPYFYQNIPTTVRQRVTWLLSRAITRLRLPKQRINMKTDTDFCRSHEIRKFLERRRWHLDCRSDGKGCLVFEGRVCPAQGKGLGKGRMALTRKGNRFGLSGKWSVLFLGLSWLLKALITVLVGLILKDLETRFHWNFYAKSWVSDLVGLG